jgi:PAS domain S-box/PAS domain S-box/PAS domain S-box
MNVNEDNLEKCRKDLEKERAFAGRLLDSVPTPMSITTLDGKIISANSRCEDFFGRSNEELGEVLLEDLYEESDEIRETFEEAKRTGFSTCEATCIRGDKTTFPAVLNFSPVKDEEGSIINVLITATDITEMREREEEIDFIFESSLTAMILTDGEERWIRVNRTAERDLGFSRDELLGKKTSEQNCVTEETISDLQKLWEYTVEQRKEALEFTDVRWKRKDGSLLIHSASEAPFAEGEGRLYTAIDVTEARRREGDLKSTLMRSEQMINSMPVALMILDDEGKVSSVNPVLESITSYHWKDMVGKRFPEQKFMTEEATEASRLMWKEKVSKGETAIGYDMPIIDANKISTFYLCPKLG